MPCCPSILPELPISDLDCGVAVIVARDLPFESKADQSGTLDCELAWAHRIGSRKRGYSE